MLPPDIVKQIIFDTVWLRRIDTIKQYDHIIKFYRRDLNIHKQRLNQLLNLKNNLKEYYKYKKFFTQASGQDLDVVQIKIRNIKSEIFCTNSNIEDIKKYIKKMLINWSKFKYSNSSIPSRYNLVAPLPLEV